MAKLSFTTVADQSDEVAPLVLTVFELDGEDYAAVRPVDDALVKVAAIASAPPAEQAVGVASFLDLCMKPDDITEALEERGGDPFAPGNVLLVNTQGRLTARVLDRHDPLTLAKLANTVLIELVESWLGKDRSSPQDYLPSQRSGGKTSTRRSTSKASTSTRSSTANRRAR